MAMDCFAGKLAVVTGGGSGIGRELARQLAAQGCSVAACDVNPDSVAVAAATAWAAAPPGVAVTGHLCDVSDEPQVLRFRDELLEQHARDHVDLLFSNAGVFGGASFVKDSRQEWERTFAINWGGVYYCARVFLPLLIASGDGILVNTSSLNGLWATLGPGMPNTAYSTAKFAVRGFTEALIEDLRTNAPQVRVAVVLPGSVGTDILDNTRRAHGLPGPADLSDEQTEEARDFLVTAKLVAPDASPGEVRKTLVRLEKEGKDKAPLSAAEAAAIILDGVRSGAWRILVGKDVAFVDERVRSRPESAYDYAEVFKDLPADLLQGVRDLPEGIKDQLPEWVKDQLPDDYLALSRLAGRPLRRRVRSGSSCSGGRRGRGRARCPGR
jgi:NAD(P)-dependent dehydrogenase (short-subunit alcohol dehydrogenase family)